MMDLQSHSRFEDLKRSVLNFYILIIIVSANILLCSSDDPQSVVIPIDRSSSSPIPTRIIPISTATSHPSTNTNAFSINDTLQNDQLCPDFTTESQSLNAQLAGKYPSRLITINFPQQRSNPHNNYDFPCNFKIKGPNNGKTTNIGVRGIYPSYKPWNFGHSDTCNSFIKFRIPDHQYTPERAVKEPEIICRIWKRAVSQQRPTLFHPIIWYFPNRKIGISLPPSASPQNVLHHNTNTTNGSDSFKSNGTAELKYLQIVFTVSSSQTCSLRVQQYLVDESREACSTLVIPAEFRSCGVYRCSDHVHLMNEHESWTYINWGKKGEFDQHRNDGVTRSHLSDSGYMRRRTYWFTAVVRTSIVPILFFGMIFLGYKFFCVLYPSYPVLSERRARSAHGQLAIRAFNDVPIDASNLRESLAPRNSYGRALHLPTHTVTRSHCNFHNNLHAGDLSYSLPAEESPPSYESLSPPSYSEAVAKV